MEGLKHKFLDLINKQGPKIPSMGFSDEIYQSQSTAILSVNSKTVADADRPADQDILESIQAAYFSTNENFDICKFELDKLPEILDCNEIQEGFKTLKQQHQVVSKQVLQLILQKQNLCNDEFEKIISINDQLSDTLEICKQSRMDLKIAKNQFATSLGVLANYRKRKLVQNLLNSLITIKTLHSTEDKLQELLADENYAAAILLLQECQVAAQTYKHFHCIAALTTKLQETIEFTEEQLDQVLAKGHRLIFVFCNLVPKMCYSFDTTTYSKLQGAYKLLKKTEIAMDHLHMHYTSAVYNTALSIVQSHVSSVESLDPADNGKRPYKKLCVSISQDLFIPCLVDLCKALFKIILSYYQLMKWHFNDGHEESPTDANYSKTDLEENFDKNYVKQKLDNGLSRLWHDVQSKISTLLLNADLTAYKFDQFLQILNIVHRLMEVGEEFCGSKSEELQESIRKQSVNYFKNYHAHRLEELKIFLENESWEVCPVKSTFEILQLQEFKALRSVLRNFRAKAPFSPTSSGGFVSGNPGSVDCGSSNHSQDGSSLLGNYFIRFSGHGTPFDTRLDETLIEEDILADENASYSEESDEEAEELKKDFVDENCEEVATQKPVVHKREKHSSKAPILSNTTLTVLRQMGKYLQMSRLLRPIAFDIIICMNQLFDFYVYAVHSFFAADLSISSSSLYTVKLNATLKRIADNLIVDSAANEDENMPHNHDKIAKPHLSPIVNLAKPETLHGLAKRVVAVESCVFLCKQYEQLQGYIEYLVPQHNKLIIQQFFNQTIACAADLRRPVYMSVAAQAFDLRQILISMSKVNWEVKDVMSQHSNYVDILLREIQIFTMRLEDVPHEVHLPAEVYALLWENIAHIVTHTLVQGFSDAKKCTNGGRALMQLDFTQFLTKFEKLSSLRPVPHREYVENYVKAYYLPEMELEKWIRVHTEYSSKHLLGLVSCACQNNKKMRQKLIMVIDEVEKFCHR